MGSGGCKFTPSSRPNNPPSRYQAEELNFSSERTKKCKSIGVPFIVTYYLSLNSLDKIIRDNTYFLYMNEEVNNFFHPEPMVSFRSARKLSSYLGRAKLYPFHHKVGSKKKVLKIVLRFVFM